MCYIFSCFGWLLDLVQRLITFFLACWMCFAVCVGLTLAAMAGIAYGYNYQMAEWLTFTRADVTVYMRRGQFYDRPDVKPAYISRRSGDDDDDEPLQQVLVGSDDELVAADRKPSEIDSKDLPASWTGLRNAQNLVSKIVKYTEEPIQRIIVQDNADQADISADPTRTAPDYYKLTSSPSFQRTKPIAIQPNAAISTAVWRDGNNNIVMRNFQVPTEKNIDQRDYNAYSEYGYHMDDKRHKNKKGTVIVHDRKNKGGSMAATPIPHVEMDEQKPIRSSASELIMRHWGPSTTPLFEELTDDVDEDSIVYKPG